jgi:glycosyltransferase involved in cell wall biosynthesis
LQERGSLVKNVLMIVYTDYSFDARVRREAETLARTNKFRVSIIVPKNGERQEVFDVDGVRLIEVNEKKYSGKNKFWYSCSYLKFLALCFFKCTWLFFRGQVDIVHVHNMPDILVFAATVPRLFGRKLVLDVHDSMPETYLDKFSRDASLPFKLLCMEESTSAALSHRIICVNHVQKEVLVGRGIPADKITISMNVPDPVLFPSGDTILQSPSTNSAFRMVYHGTIAERLGVDLTVKAVAKLAGAIPGLEFHLWSKAGPALDAIEKLSRSLNVGHQVCIREGGVALELLSQELKIMNLGIISNRKGVATDLMLPVKMLEYVTLGIPVVAPRLKCIQYYFTEDMVSFFEAGNVESMAQVILDLYKDPVRRQRQAQNARAFLDRYGWGNHQHDLIAMYENL